MMKMTTMWAVTQRNPSQSEPAAVRGIEMTFRRRAESLRCTADVERSMASQTCQSGSSRSFWFIMPYEAGDPGSIALHLVFCGSIPPTRRRIDNSEEGWWAVRSVKSSCGEVSSLNYREIGAGGPTDTVGGLCGNAAVSGDETLGRFGTRAGSQFPDARKSP